MTYDGCKILSPVGSMDVLEWAVFSGADFVYLSGQKFGARGYADNFDFDELKEAILFCHRHNVKVFVTVNISILEREIPEVVDYVYYLYLQGADGVIVQDIGLAGIINKLIPELSIHASTQMTVYDYSFVKWLCENGYDSVNLSREVPISRIRKISGLLGRYGHDINLEVFVHGALCYCYSGQCLMSSFLGGRSGNRGLCAQPCRMRYSFRDYYNTLIKEEDYLLSTKDLCTYYNVADFIDAGVNCFKIEGRMKSKEYVASTTYAYKNAVEGNACRDDYLLLNLAFNRGLTEGYISGRNVGEVVGRNKSGNTGYPIGRVIKSTDNIVTIKFSNKSFPTKIVNGDGLKFEYDDFSCGMYVSKILSQNNNRITLAKKRGIHIEKDSMVYITYSKYLEDKTKTIINEKNIHKTNVVIEINVNNDAQMEVNASCDLIEKSIRYVSREKFEKAKNKALTQEKINKQLQKTGNTNYTIKNITYKNFPDNLFMPISTINQIRREIIEKIDKKIMQAYLPTNDEKKKTKQKIDKFKNKHYSTEKTQKRREKWNIYIDKIGQAETIKNHDYIDKVYYDGSFNHNTIDEYAEKIGDELIRIHETIPDKQLIWILPQILLDEDLPHISETIAKLKFKNINISIQTDNIGVAKNLDAESYGNNMNIYNSYSIKKLSENPGFKQIAVSPEISYNDIKGLKSQKCELEYIIFGHLQLMITKDNYEDMIEKEITNTYYLIDKRNNRYKIKKDCYSNSHIYDYRILKLDYEIEKLRSTQINNYSIDARFFNNEDTEKILEYYRKIKNNEKGKLELQENSKLFHGNLEKGVYNKG
ncbi:MAG: hypothetical protein BZ138_01650 [Methanosphaera sp. rholeuAM270]|nr:MAG: hypothetical protein BZ138_01650 [Methanosphaera sp. rholeuAM270]